MFDFSHKATTFYYKTATMQPQSAYHRKNFFVTPNLRLVIPCTPQNNIASFNSNSEVRVL